MAERQQEGTAEAGSGPSAVLESYRALVQGTSQVSVMPKHRVQIFLSSTFKDFKTERDYLIANVLPSLQAQANHLGIDFGFSTLRPLPNLILHTDFMILQEHLVPFLRPLLSTIYRIDENAIPSTHCLSVEQLNALPVDKVQMLIDAMHLVATDTGRLISDKLRSQLTSVTSMEIEAAYALGAKSHRDMLVLHRAISELDARSKSQPLVKALVDYADFASHDSTRLKHMIGDLRARDGIQYREWTLSASDLLDPGSAIRSTYLTELALAVEKFCSTAIDATHSQHIAWKSSLSSMQLQLATEIDVHLKHAAHATNHILKQRNAPVWNYLARDASQGLSPFFLQGQGASGKTTLLAQVVQHLRQDSSRALLARFCGLSTRAQHAELIFNDLAFQAEQLFDPEGAGDPATFTTERFKAALQRANSAMPVVVVIDALDQLVDLSLEFLLHSYDTVIVPEHPTTLQRLEATLHESCEAMGSILTSTDIGMFSVHTWIHPFVEQAVEKFLATMDVQPIIAVAIRYFGASLLDVDVSLHRARRVPILHPYNISSSSFEPNPRVIFQLHHLLTKAGRFEELLKHCLLNVAWVEASCQVEGPIQLMALLCQWQTLADHTDVVQAVSCLYNILRILGTELEGRQTSFATQLLLHASDREEYKEATSEQVQVYVREARGLLERGPSLLPSRPVLAHFGGGLVQVLTGHLERVTSVAFLSETRLLSASSDRTVVIWALERNEPIARLDGFNSTVSNVFVSPDKDKLLCTGATISLWNLSTLTQMHIWKQNQRAEDTHVIILAHNFHGYSVLGYPSMRCFEVPNAYNCDSETSFAPYDSKHIILCDHQRTLRLVDWRTGDCLKELRPHDGTVLFMLHDQTHQRLLTTSSDKSCKMINTAAFTIEGVFEGHSDWVNHVAISPENQRANQTPATARRHGREVTSLSSTTELILSSSRDKTAKLWTADGQLRETFEGFSYWVTACIFASDTLLVAVSEARELKLWEAVAESDGWAVHATMTVEHKVNALACIGQKRRFLCLGEVTGRIQVLQLDDFSPTARVELEDGPVVAMIGQKHVLAAVSKGGQCLLLLLDEQLGLLSKIRAIRVPAGQSSFVLDLVRSRLQVQPPTEILLHSRAGSTASTLLAGLFDGSIAHFDQRASAAAEVLAAAPTAQEVVVHAGRSRTLSELYRPEVADRLDKLRKNRADAVGAYFWKQGEKGVLAGRKKRYFIRKGSIMEYYKCRDGKPTIYKGYIDLGTILTCRVEGDCLLLVGDKREWNLKEDAPGAAKKWLDALDKEGIVRSLTT
ncbi:uncharacterized protein MONBRDRAFT_22897 [Monosiga brevicollis MX1]|uniref:Nephrocystin 3-like N-terminal domain-containing protein n=1 Tax=Monosiga brevicollis TaxID=81824 RepID=A9USE1_MONBE|nr:uncharacterized protein MONBRDRAFT_22897 [Monosiga brevicollis MX1]EDQ92085.1 predicted protein [Monosiga brevicollis MX1]|eukprot:XP_001743371.1 hypothetical protein [Monosiga brevicollis MX1]